MKITDILAPKIANDSLLLGYYGGGNYGDDLLLEVIQNIASKAGVRDMKIAYQFPENYATYHHEFGYPRVNMHRKPAIIRALFGSRSVIVGGGGLWGLDFAFNVFLLSLMLFVARWILRKKVYLIGVGYYNSTTKFGHFGAWLAGKAANQILARDQETYENFRHVTKHVELDRDIAWNIRSLNLNAYLPDVTLLDNQLHVTDKTLLIALRRFPVKHRNEFTNEIETFIANNTTTPIIVTLLEPQHVDPEQHALIASWAERYDNVRAILEPHNPLTFFMFFQKHAHQLALIAPQFHAIITAHLNGVPFLPVVYDNKVAELLAQIGQRDPIPIRELQQTHLQAFADDFYGGAA